MLAGDGSTFTSDYVKQDGKLYTHYIVGLTVKDKQFAVEFAKALQSIGLHPQVRKIGKKKQYWKCEASSKQLVIWHKNRTFVDLRQMLNTKERKVAFLKGFYESEGSYYLDQRAKHFRLAISNTNKEITEMIQEIITSLGIHSKIQSNAGKHWLPVYITINLLSTKIMNPKGYYR